MRRSSPAFLFAAAFLALPFFQIECARAQDANPPPPAAPSDKSTAKTEASEESRAHRAECSWLGQRVISLLWRDDVNTAREQTRFYEMFGCPTEHLSVAFRCVIEQSQSQPDQNDLNARAYSCWMSPETGQTQE